ncbi:MAG: hypothetical protein MJY83_05220 [Bacteroidales bacterium]|nr:hypothetical protein [Bacteroidales bacterium]
MKKVFMSFAVVAMMVAVSACGNNKKSEAAAEETATEACECCTECSDSTCTECCDSTCTECAEAAEQVAE